MKAESSIPQRAAEKSSIQRPRFEIVRLEERIAPNKGGTPNGDHGGNSGCHLDPICK